MLRKYATLQTLEAFQVPAHATGRALRKAAHRVSFDYTPRPGYLYVRSRAISSRCNDNYDEFPAEEIKKAYATFVGKPVFVNHHNDNHKRARGVIIDAALHEDRNPDGSPDTWAEVLMEVDAKSFPKLAKAILAGEVDRTSMGCDVQLSVCSACGNKATNPSEYCHHIPAMKGQRIFRVNASTGRREGHLVREICHGLGFFENSLLVEEPADPTAFFLGVDDRGLKATASKTAGMHPDAACPNCGGTNFEPLQSGNLPSHKGEDFTHQWSLAYCNNCEEPFNAGKSYEQTRADKEFAKHHRDEYVKDRNKGDELFKNFTDHPTKPIVDWGEEDRELNRRQHPERVDMTRAGIPLNIDSELGRKLFEQKKERALTHSKPWRPAEGPMDPRHLSKKVASMTETAYSPLADDGYELDRMQAEAAAGPKYPDPKDHPFFQEHPSHPDNIVKAWHEANEGQKAQGKRWYSDAHEIATAIGKGDSALGAGVLAAYSPKAAWPSNMFNAARSLKEGRALGKGEGDSIMGMHQRLAQKMIDGEHHSRVLKSPKISDFAHLIEHGGDEDPDHHTRVVVDRHAMSVATGKRMTTKDLEEAPLGSRHYYEHVANHFRMAAGAISEHEGERVYPHQVQAVTWLVQQHKNIAHDLSMPGPGGKGRQTRDKNVWNRWTEEHHHHAPDLHPENIHGKNPHVSKRAPFAGYEDFEDVGMSKKATSDEEIWKGLNLPKAEDTHGEVSKMKGKDFADALMAPLYEPYGGEENYHLHQKNENMMDLKRRYEGGSGKFGFDSDDDGGEAYYEVRHPSGWTLRHYADGPHAEIRHKATPGEAHEMIDIGGPRPDNPFAHHRPPENFGHKELKSELDNWVNEGGRGIIEHLEGQYGDPRIRRWKRTMGTRKRALDEVKAPPEVDTLRDEECPVCGDADVFDGERCPICGFIAPPSMFRDPDLEVAKQMDLRGDQIPGGSELPGGGGLVDPSQLGPGGTGEAAAEQLQHPDQLNPNGEVPEPGTPGDGIPDLFCPACGEGVDAGQPMSQVEGDPNATPAAGPEEGMPCPNCGQATLLSSGDMQQLEQMGEMAGGEEGQEGGLVSPEELPEGGEEEEQAVPGEEDPEQAPDQEEGGEESLPPSDDEEETDDSAVDDEDPAAKKRDKNSKGASMSKAVEAAVKAQAGVIDGLQRANASLQRENFILQTKLAFLAKVAGVEEQFAAIQRQADINNPASPVPDPPEQAAYETTEQALAPETMDNVQAPGETPGSVQHVPAEQVDVPMSPGVTMPTAPANQLVDVTAPVAGTNTGEVPLNETRIETDVRVGEDPLRASGPGVGGLGNDGTAFPWTMSSKEGQALASNRTMASMRLARLRLVAGLATGDEFTIATKIETDKALPDAVIAHEIRTLEGLAKASAKRERPAGLVPRATSGGRKAPSMASLGQTTAAYDADGADEELFLNA